MSDLLLARAVRLLAAAKDVEHALAGMAALLVADLGGWCLVDRVEPPDLVTRVAAIGPDGPLELAADEGPVHARRSSARAHGVLARLVEAPGQRLRMSSHDLTAMASSEDPRLRAQAAMARRLGTTDVVVLGLGSNDMLLGVVSVGRTSGEFRPAEVDQLADLARLVGMALFGLRLHQVQRSVSTALQQSLLPALPVVPGLTLAARFVPAGDRLAVGGDWYDVFALSRGEVTFVVGDVTGHDVQAAARMAELRNLLRAIAVDRAGPPWVTLRRLDRVLARVGSELSATCVVAQLSDERGGARELRWSSAGHLPPVLLRDGRAELLETVPDLMVGVDPRTLRSDHVRQLEPGDVVLLFTDGLVEDRNTPVTLGLRRLCELVEEHAGASPEGLADLVVGHLAGSEDDAAVLVVQVDREQTGC